jgi:riboflavin synthase
MFTGIVEEVGFTESMSKVDKGWSLTVRAQQVLQDTQVGDSLAVNGTCLTVTALTPETFTVGVAPETLRRTNLGDLKPGDGVNLERALRADSRMGGHFVQGHVDGTGIVRQRKPEGDSLWLTVEAPPTILRYLVPKGFIAVDGVSLTIVDVEDDWFTFMLIEYTQKHTVLAQRPVGSRVNLEIDILGKYVEKLLMGGPYALGNR